MKKLIYFFVFLPAISYGQCGVFYQGILTAQVNGDTVILHEDTAERNCLAAYVMKIAIVADTLYWLQYDTGLIAGCMCTFNLSVTIDSVKTGIYTAKVYFTEFRWPPPPEYDTCYVGSVPFEITDQNSYASINKVNGFQSDCFGWSIADSKIRNITVNLYPNPVSDFLIVKTTIPGKKLICISDLNNQTILELSTDEQNKNIYVGNFRAGIYFISVKSNKSLVRQKICKY